MKGNFTLMTWKGKKNVTHCSWLLGSGRKYSL